MARHRAVIIGAGRIGAGFNFGPWPYIYDHASTYQALERRVDLIGFVEPDLIRAEAAKAKFGKPVWSDLDEAMKAKPDIVSVCTNHEVRPDLTKYPFIKGVWCEKPMGDLKVGPLTQVQVNYIRRFDVNHALSAPNGNLVVFGKKDIHTVCHFTDLARYWQMERHQLQYAPIDGPCHYVLIRGPRVDAFPMGGVVGGFMETALENLLDAVDGKRKLLSPAENAVESERWANEILES